jgi:hypothetical protein
MGGSSGTAYPEGGGALSMGMSMGGDSYA